MQCTTRISSFVAESYLCPTYTTEINESTGEDDDCGMTSTVEKVVFAAEPKCALYLHVTI